MHSHLLVFPQLSRSVSLFLYFEVQIRSIEIIAPTSFQDSTALDCNLVVTCCVVLCYVDGDILKMMYQLIQHCEAISHNMQFISAMADQLYPLNLAHSCSRHNTMRCVLNQGQWNKPYMKGSWQYDKIAHALAQACALVFSTVIYPKNSRLLCPFLINATRWTL